MQEKSKLNFLNSIEEHVEKTAEVNEKEKYFITFPYPYMNGKLHLGHLFSISKSDFFSYYQELKGKNVLFPFSFHCTGMPIAASAKKLAEELNGKKTDISTKAIIQSMGFTDVEPFTDPNYWIRTFPKFATSVLKNFHSNIDWSRSFITTDINKYYDSFVRWQFYKLKELGFISFGKRHSIFCPLDRQACLDHDRRKGENVKPISTIVAKMVCDAGVLLARVKNVVAPAKVIIPKNKKFIEFEYSNIHYFVEKDAYENIVEQANDIKYISDVSGNFFENQKFVFAEKEMKTEMLDKDVQCIVKENPKVKGNVEQNLFNENEIKILKKEQEDILKIETIDTLAETKNLFIFYEPEEEVISRSGGKCVVSLLDQWYIDYGNPDWKKMVKKCLDGLTCEKDTGDILRDALDWINKWGFSRSFGLGTKIPWDPQYLIDSLSDSTIYMAMYTVKNFMYKDLEGKDEIFPSNCLSNDVWDYIFHGKELSPELKAHEEILKNCRKSFEYFYPVDLRVSGKDLLKNHLIFFLFNHVALFKEEQWPKRIFTNGYLMLNSAKMSKSEGNFMTAEDAIEKFGASATRMCLAVCGDTNEDANFIEANANSFILKLHSFVKSIEENDAEVGIEKISVEFMKTTEKNKPESGEEQSFADQFLIETISFNTDMALKAHERLFYRDVVKFGFFEMIHAKEMYHTLGGNDPKLVSLLYRTISQLLYPVIPSLSRHLIKKYYSSDFSLPIVITNDTKCIKAVEYLKDVLKKIMGHKKRQSSESVEILVGAEFVEWKQKCMVIVDQIRNEVVSDELSSNDKKKCMSKIIESIKTILKEYGIPEKRGILFAMDYMHYPEKYDIVFNEYAILDRFKNYIENNAGIKVFVIMSPSVDPGSPALEFK